MREKKPVPQDFPLLPRPLDIDDESYNFMQDLVARIDAGEEVSKGKLTAAIIVLIVELMAQLEWRNEMMEWLDELNHWLNNSPNINRKGE